MAILERDGIRIDYREAGEGDPVVLIHGSVIGNGQWRRLTDALVPRYRVLAPNLYGYGETPRWTSPRPLLIDEQVRLVETLLEPGRGPVHVVGHSYGATVAMFVAMRWASRLASLVLLEPNAFGLLAEAGRHDALAEVLELRADVRRYGAAGEWERLAERFADFWGAPGTWAAMPPERREFFVRWIPPDYREWDAFDHEIPDLLNAFAPLADRTLVVTARDTRRSLREVAEVLQGALPGLTWTEIPEGGHMAPLTRPDLVNPLVIAHIQRFST